MKPPVNSPTPSATCVGLDIGYGALKLVHGEIPSADGTAIVPKEKLLPVGAAVARLVAQEDVVNINRADSGYPVLVKGEPWIAGVAPSRIQGGQGRQLDEHYSSTDEYGALFLAALAHVGSRDIDVLVTGLPTAQALKRSIVDELTVRLTGKHAVNESLAVNVRRVKVVPQPVGGYKDFVSHNPHVLTNETDYLLVVDPGFFSCDWIVLQGRRPLPEYSSSSTHGWSRVLELTQVELGRLHPQFKVGINRLDDAMRRGVASAFDLGRAGKIDLMPLFTSAAAEVARSAMPGMRAKLRMMSDTPSHVLVCGGAAEAFMPVIQECFPAAVVHIAPRPQFANARGFFRSAAEISQADAKAPKVA